MSSGIKNKQTLLLECKQYFPLQTSSAISDFKDFFGQKTIMMLISFFVLYD